MLTALTEQNQYSLSIDPFIKIAINRYKLHGNWSEVQMKPLLTY